MKLFKVGFDIDDVLMPWYFRAHQICVAAGLAGDVVPATWRPYDEYPDCSKEQWIGALQAATANGDLYLQGPPDEDAARALRSLLFDGHEVHLITARGTLEGLGDTRVIVKHTHRWLERNAIPCESLSFTRHKGARVTELGLDFFIDDNGDNWREVKHALGSWYMFNEVPKSFLLDRPWNQGVVTFPRERVSSVQQYVDIIKEAANRE